MLRVITMFVVMSASVLGTTSTAFAQAPGAVVYPAPEGETLSGDFTVTVAGQAAPVTHDAPRALVAAQVERQPGLLDPPRALLDQRLDQR
ncbi:MAG TPA: hypothetical protein PKZ25_02550, partial [Candidatus Hydrogenedentes bacterium]|nr:hypothetical protein [Candidatus Hydrogenedentota bacterium]